MWDKIVEILVSKLWQLPTREQKAERRMKEKIVFLHEGLVYCDDAYVQYKSDPSDENFVNWQRSVDYLIRLLEEVRTTLATFAPDAFNHAVNYVKPVQIKVA
jgi:hypothetical protein